MKKLLLSVIYETFLDIISFADIWKIK